MEADLEKQTTLSIQPSFRIFVSHSHKDNDFCLKLVHDLRSHLNDYDAVWHDASGGLHGGEAWWRKIVREVEERNVFIVVLSPDAMISPWVDDEIDLAWQRKNSPAGMLIIPILYRECDMRDDLKTRQIISFLHPESYEIAFQELLRALERSLYPQSKIPPTLPPLHTSPLRRPRVGHQTPPMWIPPRSQMFVDMPDLEKLAPESNKQEEIPAPLSKSAVTLSTTKPAKRTKVEDSLKVGQDEDRTFKFSIGSVSVFLYWFAIVLEVLLAMRFLFKLFGADPSNPFAAFLYALSDIILFPFSTLVHNPSLQLYQAIEITTLIGMLVYWIIFWLSRSFCLILISEPQEPRK